MGSWLRVLAGIACAVLAACSLSVEPTFYDAYADRAYVDAGMRDAQRDGTTTCGNATCGADQVCCTFSGSCVPAACTDCCRPPTVDGGMPCSAPQECPSNDDCIFATSGCSSVGVCVPHIDTCGRASRTYCGCAGTSFIDTCE